MAEANVPDFEISGWAGLFAPAGTPRPVIQTVQQQVRKALKSPGVQQQLAEQGSDAVGGTPEQFSAFIASEIRKWGAAVKTARAKVD